MDRDQFISNVEREQEGLRKFLLALCGGVADKADDIAQEALVKAYLASGIYVPRAKFSTWLYRIAYNCFIDSLRKQSVEVSDIDPLQMHNCVSSVFSDDAFKYQELYAAIDELSPSERASVLLFYMEGKSVREITKILGIPSGTVRSQLSRGREKLRKMISR